MVYRANTDGTCMLVEVTQSPDNWGWSSYTQANNKDNGLANLAIIRTIDPTFADFPAFGYCDRKNSDPTNPDWYLPAWKELRALLAGYCGLKWVESGADQSKGEINDWGEEQSDVMPYYGSYDEQRAKFNAKMTAAGGTAFSTYNWSSSETLNYDFAWGIDFETGASNVEDKSDPSLKTRCVRKVMPQVL